MRAVPFYKLLLNVISGAVESKFKIFLYCRTVDMIALLSPVITSIRIDFYEKSWTPNEILLFHRNKSEYRGLFQYT